MFPAPHDRAPPADEPLFGKIGLRCIHTRTCNTDDPPSRGDDFPETPPKPPLSAPPPQCAGPMAAEAYQRAKSKEHNGTSARRAYGSLGDLSSRRESPRLQSDTLLAESWLRGYGGHKLISNGKVRGETSSPRDMCAPCIPARTQPNHAIQYVPISNQAPILSHPAYCRTLKYFFRPLRTEPRRGMSCSLERSGANASIRATLTRAIRQEQATVSRKHARNDAFRPPCPNVLGPWPPKQAKQA